MISIKNRHFNVHRILLLAIGLWPCQRSRLVQFQMILCFGILVSSIGFQLLTLITTEFTFDHVINAFSVGLVFTMYVIMYNAFWYNFTEIVERPLEELQHICNELKDKEEIVIMKKYGDNIKRFTFYALVLYICDLIILLPTISLSIMPNTFTVALHISESELRHILYKYIPKYFVDRKNYLCVVLLYFDAIVCIGATTFLATGLMLFAYLKHACGMLRIASYRIKKAINIRNNICPKNEAIMYKGIIYAIHIHRTAIKYNVQWYVAPLRIQKLILFLLQRGNKNVNLNFGGVFILSLEFFASLMKVSTSYFTVIYSMQD
ncbi:uncharacterized protein LOC109610280 isoform X4 [Camponotus floridanus]|uniref:uncharacterized protein LOC109610280 isoform X4 n=1 Tax=Camponotus floridanus TaxID=104421 RepID=UPI000DC6BB4F|nr:uncharacterized protein LOC109610280 isoform X4 [Camponotus floridanus]